MAFRQFGVQVKHAPLTAALRAWVGGVVEVVNGVSKQFSDELLRLARSPPQWQECSPSPEGHFSSSRQPLPPGGKLPPQQETAIQAGRLLSERLSTYRYVCRNSVGGSEGGLPSHEGTLSQQGVVSMQASEGTYSSFVIPYSSCSCYGKFGVQTGTLAFRRAVWR